MATSSSLNEGLLKLDFNKVFDYLFKTDNSDLSLPQLRIYPLFEKYKAPTPYADQKYFSIQTGGFESILTPHTEGATVNKSSETTFKELNIQASMFAGGFEITRETKQKAEARGKDGVKNFVKMQTERLLKAYDLDLDNYFASENSTGTGILAQVNGAVSGSAVITYDNPTYVGQFRVGQIIDIYNGGTQQVDSVKIIDVDRNENKFTLESNVTVSDNAYIYKEDTKDSMFDGLFSIVNNTTFQGINPSSSGNSFWEATTYDAGGSALTEAIMDRFFDTAIVGGDGVLFDVLMMNAATKRKLKSILIGDRILNDPTVIRGGVKFAKTIETDYGNVPYINNRFWTTNIVMGIKTSAIKLFEFVPFTWVKGEGGNILSLLDGKLDWEAKYLHWFNYGTDMRSVHAKMTNFTT